MMQCSTENDNTRLIVSSVAEINKHSSKQPSFQVVNLTGVSKHIYKNVVALYTK